MLFSAFSPARQSGLLDRDEVGVFLFNRIQNIPGISAPGDAEVKAALSIIL